MARLSKFFTPGKSFQEGDLLAEAILEAIAPIISSSHKSRAPVWFTGNVLFILGLALMVSETDREMDTAFLVDWFHEVSETGDLHDYFFGGLNEFEEPLDPD